MQRITGWVVRTVSCALTITAFVACADSPPTAPRAAKGQPSAMVAACDTFDGCCSSETAIIPCDGGSGGGGGGYPAVPSTNVKLTWFVNSLDGSSDNRYYEIRNRFLDANGTQIYYNAQWVHGGAFVNGEFTSLDLGRPFPCNGTIRVEVYREFYNYFGHVIGDAYAGTTLLDAGSAGQQIPIYSPDNPVTVRYAWPAGTCQ
jgi:hypothetical protein